MIQFITVPDSEYSAAEQAQMFVEAGGMWIQMALAGKSSDLKDEVSIVAEIAKAEESFLVLEHDVELVDEMKVHGVHLYPGDMLPADAREKLGPHAVIGVTVNSAEEIVALKSADIDYVQVGPYPKVSLADYRNIVAKVRESGVEIPIVATGDITLDNIVQVLESGVSGVALSNAPLEAENPVEYFRKAFELVSNRCCE